MSVANPFIDPNIEFEPWQQLKQKPLKVNPKTSFNYKKLIYTTWLKVTSILTLRVYQWMLLKRWRLDLPLLWN